MKKTLVAAGIIVALGVVWTGGAWYTGKQLESHIADMVSQANAQLKLSAPEAGLEISYQDYQRGVFSSQLKMVVKPLAGAENSWLKAGQSVILDESVSHGPIPLASLKSFNLAPAMASVNTVLVNNEVTKPLFDLAKGQSPFDINTRISYNGDTESAIALKPLDYEKDAEKVTFSGGDFVLSADSQGSLVSLTGEAKSGQVNAVNEYNQKVQFIFNGLKTDGSSKLTSFDERIGDQTLSLERLAVSVEGKDLAELTGMRIAGKSSLTPDGKKLTASSITR
ncbi:putative GTP-binding protein [Kluyvera ascorbata ATCC 33433]|nr:putative GTP-binding protein [Kluyvera ascorbata ATCC 33433]